MHVCLWSSSHPSDIARIFALVSRFGLCVGFAACPAVGGLTRCPLNVVNRAIVISTGRMMPICSFYIKTNIVIPTCRYDRSPALLAPLW